MSIPSAKSIIDLFEKGETAEAHAKILKLRRMAIDFQKQIAELRGQILKLQGKLRSLESIEGGTCPKCRKPAWLIESSKPDPQFGDVGGIRRVYKCFECGYSETRLVVPNLINGK